MNKPVYLQLKILELSNISMYEFWYDYVKPKYGKKSKFCYMDTNSFFLYIKIHDIYKDVGENAKTRFHISNYALERALPKGKNKK